jgi:hypothetical protein
MTFASLAIARIQPSTVVTIPDHRNLLATWRLSKFPMRSEPILSKKRWIRGA